MAGLKGDVARIVRRLVQDHGCEASCKSGHWKVTRPGYGPVFMSQTPSDNRAVDNIKADIRKYLGIRL